MMKQHVYFSFHFEKDIHRVDQVREHLAGSECEAVGFFDPEEYERLLRSDKATIRRMIRERVARTSVTIVLIGTDTASQPFVHLGIEESIANQNGFVGINIHGIDDEEGNPSFSGVRPILPAEIEFPCFVWDWDLIRLEAEIEAAGLRAHRWRTQAPVGSGGSGR